MKLDEKILFMAFRYALGRMTYVVNEVADTLVDKWEEISPRYQKLIHKEIKQAIADKNAGMEMDVEQWEIVLKMPNGECECGFPLVRTGTPEYCGNCGRDFK